MPSCPHCGTSTGTHWPGCPFGPSPAVDPFRAATPTPYPDESYPDGWLHATIHLNPDTGEMHSDSDHRVRHWIAERLPTPHPVGTRYSEVPDDTSNDGEDTFAAIRNATPHPDTGDAPTPVPADAVMRGGMEAIEAMRWLARFHAGSTLADAFARHADAVEALMKVAIPARPAEPSVVRVVLDVELRQDRIDEMYDEDETPPRVLEELRALDRCDLFDVLNWPDGGGWAVVKAHRIEVGGEIEAA